MALSYFVCASLVGGTGGTLTLPITADVPRSDPILGATIILVYAQSVPGGVTIFGISDDAPIDDGYSLCLFTDGLNHYTNSAAPGPFPNLGLVVNPLTNGVHNLTVNTDVATWVALAAIAVTGVGGSWPGLPLDPSVSWLYNAIHYASEQPVGGGSSIAQGVSWADSAGTLTFSGPSGATDTNWDWIGGELAFYALQDTSATDLGPWTWTDGAMTDFLQWDVNSGLNFMSTAIGAALVNPGIAAPSLAGAWSDASQNGTGQGLAIASGAGPVCGTPPPPGGGVPILHGHIRLSE